MGAAFGEDAGGMEERDRIAIDLHDSVIQTLYGVGLRLENCLDCVEDAERLRREIEKSIEALDAAIAALRDFIFGLQPRPGAGSGLPETLLALLHHHSAGTLMQTNLSVLGQEAPALDDARKTQLFRIADEALANVAKHSRARRVAVELGQEGDKVILRIVDDGIGIDWEKVRWGKGVASMKALAAAMGGKLAVRDAAGGGTEVEVAIPVGGVAGG